MRTLCCATIVCLLVSPFAEAALVTDPDDPRSWQGATVGTFAALYYGSDTLANRQLVVDNELLDDGIFDPTGYTASTLVVGSGLTTGTSFDLTGTGSYDYATGTVDVATAANSIDEHWLQTSGVVGETVWDLGFNATKAAVFNTIDHGPLPQEAIESTVYLSSSSTGPWVQAVVERVWLEGFQSNLGILWDGFVYAVGTGTTDTFRYASIIHGGPGALIDDGDDEINGILGTGEDFEIPEPSTIVMLGLGVVFSFARRFQRD